MTLKRKIRHSFKITAYIALSLVILFTLSVATRIIFNPSSVRAGSAVFYPKFCLGGWDHPQKASGDPELAQSSPASAYTTENSAYLSSSLSAQIFCGYFSNEDKTNSPSEVTVAFNWHMVGIDDAVKAPTEVLIVPNNASSSSQTVQYDSSGPSTITLIETPATTTRSAPVVETPASTSTEPVVQTPVIPETPASTSAPETTPAPTTEPSSGETTMTERFLSLVTPVAHAEASTQISSNSPLFEISYSIDGIRWSSIGTVGVDNWKDYSIKIPVKTWDELNRLQLSVSPLPSLDKRPDMYLESIAARVVYDRTLAESASDAVDAVVSAVDTVATVITNIPFVADILPVPQKTYITKKTLSFSVQGSPEGLDGKASPTVVLSSEGESLKILGSCSDKYFVILMYKNQNDFKDDPASLVANEARECEGGAFSYDLASLPSDVKSGTYYVLTGEEGNRGPWRPTSSPFPVSVVASTTVEEIIQ